MQFFGKFDKIVCWRPRPTGLAPPPTGNPGSAQRLKYLPCSHLCLSNHIYRPQRSWAKVIFSQASVCPRGVGRVWSRGGGVLVRRVGVSNFSGGGHLPIFFSFFFNFYFFPPKKILLGCTNPWDGQCAAGTHPTGMHSCLNNLFCCERRKKTRMHSNSGHSRQLSQLCPPQNIIIFINVLYANRTD